MKNLTLAIVLIILLFGAWNQAAAGDSVTIAVSCVIPAIPGVNAPPFPEEKPAPQENKTEQNLNNQAPDQVIVSETKEIILAQAQNKAEEITVQTIYSR